MSEPTKVEEMRESPAGRSMIALYQSCPRAWAFKYVKGFKDKTVPEHLILGSGIHEAHEVFYESGFSRNAMMGRAEEFFNEHDPLLLNKALVMLEIWFQKVGINDLSMSKVLGVEQEVYLTLPNGFVMSCRMDRLLQDKRSGEVFICDTKTTGWSLEKTLRNYTYHSQPQLYFMAARETLPGITENCRGWRTDGIYAKARISGGVPTGDWYTDATRSETVVFHEKLLEDTKNSYAVVTDNIAYSVTSSDEGEPLSLCFPKNNEHCLAYNRVCPFYSICHQIDELDGVPANFELDPWLESGEVLNNFRNLEV